MAQRRVTKAGTLLLLCLCLCNFFLLQFFISSSVPQTFLRKPGYTRPVRSSHPTSNFSLYPQQWKPEQWKLKQLYRYLNLTPEEAASSLATTVPDRYILNNHKLCGSMAGGRLLDVLFMVHTAPQHFSQRRRLRRTILNASYFPRFEDELGIEHRVFKDTVQGDFLDTYMNLTLKGVFGFNWVRHYCPHVKYIFKMDDDTFVDTFKLFHRFWPALMGKTRTIFCNVWFNSSVPIMREGKWKVEARLFSNLTLFPFYYCTGMAVLISGDLIPFLYQAAMFAPFFWIDDIFLFGILPWVAGNVSIHNLDFYQNYIVLDAAHMVKCLKEKGSDCPVLAAHSPVPTDYFEELWNLTLTLQDLNVQKLHIYRVV